MKRLLFVTTLSLAVCLAPQAQDAALVAVAQTGPADHSMVALAWVDLDLLDAEGDRIALAVFPNPATDRAGAQFTLEVGQGTVIDVFDLLGRRVRQLDLGFLEAGQHEAQLQLHGLPHGLYIVRLTGDAGARATVRLTVATAA